MRAEPGSIAAKGCSLSLLAALLFSGPALALDYKWWGAGPSLGTVLIPMGYPSAFPAGARSTVTGGADDGDTIDEIDKVRGDIELGARAIIYPSQWGRLGARGEIGFGTSGYTRFQLTAEYDARVYKADGVQLLLGGGIGIGRETFHDGGDPSGSVADDKLKVTYFPLRVGPSVLLRDKTRAYELGIYTQFHVVGNQEYCTTDAACAPATETADGGIFDAVSFLYWDFIGLNATVWFGDFKNDAKKKSSKKKSSKQPTKGR